MTFLTDEILEQYKVWFTKFSNGELVRQVSIMETLIDNDDFAEGLFIDQAIELLRLLHDECVCRVGLLASVEKAQADCNEKLLLSK